MLHLVFLFYTVWVTKPQKTRFVHIPNSPFTCSTFCFFSPYSSFLLFLSNQEKRWTTTSETEQTHLTIHKPLITGHHQHLHHQQPIIIPCTDHPPPSTLGSVNRVTRSTRPPPPVPQTFITPLLPHLLVSIFIHLLFLCFSFNWWLRKLGNFSSCHYADLRV